MDIAIALLQYYSFDLGDYSIKDLVNFWHKYDPIWVRLAIVESLYRGRYKAISVDQILEFWQRRGEPHCRFSREFERLICGDFVFPLPNLPRKVTYTSYKPSSQSKAQTESKNYQPPTQPYTGQNDRQPSSQNSLSPTYQSAMQQMSLLAESSLFVDKLKSMCKGSSYNSLDLGETEEIDAII